MIEPWRSNQRETLGKNVSRRYLPYVQAQTQVTEPHYYNKTSPTQANYKGKILFTTGTYLPSALVSRTLASAEREILVQADGPTKRCTAEYPAFFWQRGVIWEKTKSTSDIYNTKSSRN